MSFTTKNTANRAKKPKFISLQDAAELLAIDESSLRKRKCGTEDLNHIQMGRRVVLLESEVVALMERKIEEAVEAHPLRRAERKLRLA